MAEHYGIKEASEMLALSEKEVFEAIRDGLLPAKLENNEWRIPDWGIRALECERFWIREKANSLISL
jgi:O-succinylbenzoate synthase